MFVPRVSAIRAPRVWTIVSVVAVPEAPLAFCQWRCHFLILILCSLLAFLAADVAHHLIYLPGSKCKTKYEEKKWRADKMSLYTPAITPFFAETLGSGVHSGDEHAATIFT